MNMLCASCRIRRATRVGVAAAGIISVWCEMCAQGHGRPLHWPWRRPLSVAWWVYMNLRGGRRGRKERLARAAKEHRG